MTDTRIDATDLVDELTASIVDAIERTALAHPGTRVIVHSETRPDDTTLGDLWNQSLQLAGALGSRGVAPGDVVAIQLPNWTECLLAHAAAWQVGAVVLPIVPIYGHRDVAEIVHRSGAKVFIGPRRWRARDWAPVFTAVDELAGSRLTVVVGDTLPGAISFSDLVGAPLTSQTIHRETNLDERALLVYTSGTTSAPKGVQHTHASLLGEVRAMIKLRGSGPDVTSLAVFPSGHIAGTLGILRLLTRGTLTVLMDQWDPVAAAHLVVEHQVQASGGAPIHLGGLLDVADAEGLDLSCLGEYTTGAANVSPELVRRADAHGVHAFRCYGSTEHPTISSGVVSDPVDKRALTDGRPTPGTQVRILGEDDREVGVGTDGEIVCRGPEQFVGYTDEALNQSSFVDGWFRTGDIGKLDADGYLQITDRKKDIIVRGGENISSKEVEDILLLLPAVSQVAVIGRPDEKYGERVCAFIVLSTDAELTLDQVQAHFIDQGVARQKTPESLEIVTQFPRTASGKVQKPHLRAMLVDRD